MDNITQTNQAKFFAMVQNYNPPINNSTICKKDLEIMGFLKTSGSDIFFTMAMLQEMGEESVRLLNTFNILRVVKVTLRSFMKPLEDIAPEYTYEQALIAYSKVFYAMFVNGHPNSTPDKAITTLRLYSALVKNYSSKDVKLITGFTEKDFNKRFSGQLEHLLIHVQDWDIYRLAKVNKLSKSLNINLPQSYIDTVLNIKERLEKELDKDHNNHELSKQVSIAQKILNS